jgi:hypothetical protein
LNIKAITTGITIFLAIVLIVALGGGIYMKMTQSSETYKAKEQVYYTSEPHFGFMSFGCARYEIKPIK